jgi:hypothetical protein
MEAKNYLHVLPGVRIYRVIPVDRLLDLFQKGENILTSESREQVLAKRPA